MKSAGVMKRGAVRDSLKKLKNRIIEHASSQVLFGHAPDYYSRVSISILHQQLMVGRNETYDALNHI